MTGDAAGGAADPATGDRLRGADVATVRRALADRDPFPGGAGFAGRVAAGGASFMNREGSGGPRLVRDVLGRQPLFVERGASDPTAGEAWSFDPATLTDPEALPAGTTASPSGERTTAWTLPDPPAADPEPAQAAVTEAVTAAVEAVGDADAGATAVAFSGGVDSALAATGVPDAPCYVAGFEGSHDLSAAREAAAEMDRELRVVELTHADLERAVPELVAATGRSNAMDLNIALPLYLTAEAVAADGFERLVVGQGADELFGGYSKVVEPAADHRVDADTVRGARRETMLTLPAQLERDVLALRAAGVEPVAPFLDDRVVAAALELPGDLLATPDERKVALRRAARGAVPESVRTADKKAVQYGTYVARELDRLARQAGFKRRMDDHVGQYVDALVAGEV
ncbi:asparagine synthetase B [Haloparvum alkalitolerans]